MGFLGEFGKFLFGESEQEKITKAREERFHWELQTGNIVAAQLASLDQDLRDKFDELTLDGHVSVSGALKALAPEITAKANGQLPTNPKKRELENGTGFGAWVAQAQGRLVTYVTTNLATDNNHEGFAMDADSTTRSGDVEINYDQTTDYSHIIEGLKRGTVIYDSKTGAYVGKQLYEKLNGQIPNSKNPNSGMHVYFGSYPELTQEQQQAEQKKWNNVFAKLASGTFDNPSPYPKSEPIDWTTEGDRIAEANKGRDLSEDYACW